MNKDNSPIVGFYATVSDRSIGSVGYFPVIDGDVEGARTRAANAIESWDGAIVAVFADGTRIRVTEPTPHTEADAAERAAIIDAYDPSAIGTPRARAMRRRQRAAGAAAREAVLAKYA